MPRMEPNSAGYTLYAVLAEELDETGIPLAYMFARPTAGRAPNSSGPLIQLLALFLSRVLDAGFRPSFSLATRIRPRLRLSAQCFPRHESSSVIGMYFEPFAIS